MPVEVILIGLLALVCLVSLGLWLNAIRSMRALRSIIRTHVTAMQQMVIEPYAAESARSDSIEEHLLRITQALHAQINAHKQFTENAAHELQTPLAVIKSHAETLLQSSHLVETEAKSIATILANATRLSRIINALILLSKIEHGHFPLKERFAVSQVIDEILVNFEDLISARRIEVQRNYGDRLELIFSRALFEILIANLLQNSIRHNLDGGAIGIVVTSTSVEISNDGHAPDRDDLNDHFKRFVRASDSEDSLGLGLSIVKRVSDVHGLSVDYTYDHGKYIVTIDVSPVVPAN